MRGRVQSAFPTCASLWQAELRTHLVPPRGRVGGRLPAVQGLRSVEAVSAAPASGPVEGAGLSAWVANQTAIGALRRTTVCTRQRVLGGVGESGDGDYESVVLERAVM